MNYRMIIATLEIQVKSPYNLFTIISKLNFVYNKKNYSK